MTDIICPLCGKPNPPDLDECQFCHAPLKTGGFLPPEEGAGHQTKNIKTPEASSSQEAATPPTPKLPEEKSGEAVSGAKLEQSVPDWLKETEASFMEQLESTPEEPESNQLSQELDSLINTPPATPDKSNNAIDDDWLTSLLVEAGAVEAAQPEAQTTEPGPIEPETKPEPESSIEEEQALPTPPSEKPDWLTSLEAASKIKLEGGIFATEPESIQPAPPEIPEEKPPEPVEPPQQPEWLAKRAAEVPAESPKEGEAPIAPAELPSWLEALRPSDVVAPSKPVEDVSGADIITAGPLMGLRGVISAHPSAIRAQKPPTYSIKLKVTEDQQARLKLMEEMLADEGKPEPLPAKPVISPRKIMRLIVAIVLLLPIIWMIVSNNQETATPQPGDVPGVVDFTAQIQKIPANAPVLVAFDYEAGFSGELELAATNAISQLMKKNIFLTLVSTNPSGPALAESLVSHAISSLLANVGTYSNYADLGFIPGGTMGLLGLSNSPRSILPYALDEQNVWASAPLNSVSTVKDFAAVIVITNDADTARIWIEQVGTQLKNAGTPLLLITSTQAEPLIRPYYEASSGQVQGLVAGLAGGVAFARTLGNYQQDGVWGAYSAGITISVLIIFVGSIVGVLIKMIPSRKKETPRQP